MSGCGRTCVPMRACVCLCQDNNSKNDDDYYYHYSCCWARSDPHRKYVCIYIFPLFPLAAVRVMVVAMMVSGCCSAGLGYYFLIRVRNSSLVFESSRKTPSMHDVTVDACDFWTPLLWGGMGGWGDGEMI